MSGSGIKQLSAANWLMPDDVIRFFTGMERAEDYVAEVLGPRLSEKVPEDIRALFDVARGTMLYGYLYYPLFTVGLQQLFRIGEAAIQHKCAQLAISRNKKRFVDRIDWLVEKDVFSVEEADRWHALRRLRNAASHPTKQSITSPGMAIGTLYRLSEDINTLFDGA